MSVDGSREQGAAELGAVLLEAAPPAHRALRCNTAIPFHQDASVLIIGERTNANGPKEFREAILGEDWLDRSSTDAFVLHHPEAKYFNV